MKKEVIVLSGKKAMMHAEGKNGMWNPEVRRGAGIHGDTKHNRKKEKREEKRIIKDYHNNH